MTNNLSNVIAEIRSQYNPNSVTFESIKNAASLLLKALNSNDRENNKKYPVPIVSLLQQLGFGLYRANFIEPEVSGIIMVDDELPQKDSRFKESRIVITNRNDSTAHQRFTVGHEIAHYIFDFNETEDDIFISEYRTNINHKTVPKDPRAKEDRANRFAAELLMPEDAFTAEFDALKSAQGSNFSLSATVEKLSQVFDVPITSVEIRLKETNRWPA